MNLFSLDDGCFSIILNIVQALVSVIVSFQKTGINHSILMHLFYNLFIKVYKHQSFG